MDYPNSRCTHDCFRFRLDGTFTLCRFIGYSLLPDIIHTTYRLRILRYFLGHQEHNVAMYLTLKDSVSALDIRK